MGQVVWARTVLGWGRLSGLGLCWDGAGCRG